MTPLAPTAQQVMASEQWTAFRFWAVPLVCAVHPRPRSSVLRIVPLFPTAYPSCRFGNVTPFRAGLFAAPAIHADPSTVESVELLPPTAIAVLASIMAIAFMSELVVRYVHVELMSEFVLKGLSKSAVIAASVAVPAAPSVTLAVDNDGAPMVRKARVTAAARASLLVFLIPVVRVRVYQVFFVRFAWAHVIVLSLFERVTDVQRFEPVAAPACVFPVFVWSCTLVYPNVWIVPLEPTNQAAEALAPRISLRSFVVLLV
jgi:hypothetical protein